MSDFTKGDLKELFLQAAKANLIEKEQKATFHAGMKGEDAANFLGYRAQNNFTEERSNQTQSKKEKEFYQMLLHAWLYDRDRIMERMDDLIQRLEDQQVQMDEALSLWRNQDIEGARAYLEKAHGLNMDGSSDMEVLLTLRTDMKDKLETQADLVDEFRGLVREYEDHINQHPGLGDEDTTLDQYRQELEELYHKSEQMKLDYEQALVMIDKEFKHDNQSAAKIIEDVYNNIDEKQYDDVQKPDIEDPFKDYMNTLKPGL